ncbi:MAG: hypothetical protein H6907_11125 [Hyphomicrobiales bacterium]|nr:hypothetical protein [Hyphomicrobiales bacterium]MCP5372272.1 hypothetical protein [Hyphomicrobiales bacterium]
MIWLAAVASALTFCVHTFVGGPVVAKPLLAAAKLPKASKWLNYFTWHVTTVLLAAMTMALAWLASGASAEVAEPALVFFGGLSAALSVLSAAVAIRGRIHPLRFPSTSLFALTSALCWTGLIGL